MAVARSTLLAVALGCVTVRASPVHLVATEGDRFPEYFDTRVQWYGCGQTVYNQGGCGDCWAMSATTVLNDRFCIHKGADNMALEVSDGGAGEKNRMFQDASVCIGNATNCQKTSRVLSPQTLVSCMNVGEVKSSTNEYGYNITSRGCLGGEAHEAWAYFAAKGLSTMTPQGTSGCVPYLSGICGRDKNGNGCHACNSFDQCADSGAVPKVYKVDDWGWIHDEELVIGAYKTGTQNKEALKRQVDMMMEEIMTNGPIHACFDYYENFKDFFDRNPLGIYNSTENAKYGGGHCVTITGWGTDAASGLPYWLIRNSWGATWGVQGYYRFLRGAGLSGLEEMEVFAGCPENSKCKLTKGVRPYPNNHKWTNDISVGGGGKWVDHPVEDPRAQSLAHAAALARNDIMDLAPGSYAVHKLQTRVTNGLEARVVMEKPGANGETDEIYLDYTGNGEYTVRA